MTGRRKEHRKQHTVPKTYLGNFTDASGLLWMVNPSLKVFSNLPKNVLTRKNFYDVRVDGKESLFVEKAFLGTIEGQFADIYRNKIAKRLPLTLEEKVTVSVFMAAQFNRVPGRRNAVRDFLDRIQETVDAVSNLPPEAREKMASLPITSGRESIPADEFLKIRDDLDSNLSQMLPMESFQIAPILSEMKWGFMVYDVGDNFFITSDDPCTMVNPELEALYGPDALISSPGLGQDGVEFMFPLSPTVCLLAGWKLQSDGEYIPVSSEMVESANTRHFRHSSLVITHSETMANDIKRHIERRHQLHSIRNVLAKPLADIHEPIVQHGAI